jgi:hypothetical protein
MVEDCMGGEAMSLFNRKDNRRSDTATGRRLASTPKPRCPEIRPYPVALDPDWQCDQAEGHEGEHWFDDGMTKNTWSTGTVRAVCHAPDSSGTWRCDLDLDHEGNHGAGGEGSYRAGWKDPVAVPDMCHALDHTGTRRCDLDVEHEGNHSGGGGPSRESWKDETDPVPFALEEILAAVQSALSTMRSGDKGVFWSAEEHRQNGIAQLEWAEEAIDHILVGWHYPVNYPREGFHPTYTSPTWWG